MHIVYSYMSNNKTYFLFFSEGMSVRQAASYIRLSSAH